MGDEGNKLCHHYHGHTLTDHCSLQTSMQDLSNKDFNNESNI